MAAKEKKPGKKKSSTTARGNYARSKTREWLEQEGFTVAPLERSQRIMVKDKRTDEWRTIFTKHDVLGCDLLAVSPERVLFVQCKSSAETLVEGAKQILDAAPWPAAAELWVTYWPPRRPLAEGPVIYRVGRQ